MSPSEESDLLATQMESIFPLLHTKSTHSIHESYHTHEKPRLLQDCILNSASHISNHILIFGFCDELYYFISTLRSKRMNIMRDIVIVHNKLPDEYIWNRTIGIFPRVYFMLAWSFN
jgi:hypothetical protein